MEPLAMGLTAVVILLVLLFLGVHIAIALGVVGFIGLILISSLEGGITIVTRSFYTTTSSYSFTVLPLFILMGLFAESSGVTEKAFNFASRWLSSLPAGLYLVTTVSCALFAGATGSSAATAIAVGKTVLPEMRRRGYDVKLSLGCIAASGTLGVIIPPSIPIVVYGIATQESVGRLLLAGITPGILEAITYMLGVSILVKLKPSLAPPTTKYTMKERLESIPGIWGVILLFGVVIGGIYSGIFTPTEAGAWGAFAAIILAAIRTRREFFSDAKKASWGTISISGMIFFIIMTAIIFSYFLTLAGVVSAMTDFVSSRGFSPIGVLSIFILISTVLGMFMSSTAALLLIAPLAHATLIPLGFDGIWLGIILIKMFEVAVITPPVAGNIFVVKALAPDIPIEDIFRGVLPFLIMDFGNIALLIVFPQIVLWLPTMAFGK